MAARDHFSMHIAPDQSILVFDADTTGNWPLVRVRKWWTDHPDNEVLNIQGWSVADAKYLAAILVDLQVTPDGRYALAFSEAVWKQKSSFLLHAPNGYVARNPDTIITVIDLEKWKILHSIHTAAIANLAVRDARVVNNEWVAFDGATGAPPSEHGSYRFVDQLLSVPDLNAGPACVSERFAHLWRPAPEAILESTQAANDHACRDVLNAAGFASTHELETLIVRNSEIEPKAMKLRDVAWKENILARQSVTQPGEQQQLWEAEGETDMFFRYWGEYPYNELYTQNPAFESSTHLWYGLYGTHNHGLYELARYSAQGKLEAAEAAQHLLCGDPAISNLKSACGCRVVDVSEQSRALLTYCRQQRGDFAGIVQKQWLSIFHSDDLTGAGHIDLPKSSETLQAIAIGEGHAYVLTLQFGELLNVYPVAPRP